MTNFVGLLLSENSFNPEELSDTNEDNFASPMGTFDCRFEMGKTCGQMQFRRANTLALDCKIGDAIFSLQYKGKSSHLLKCSCTEEGN
jgi:hypothetical protein